MQLRKLPVLLILPVAAALLSAAPAQADTATITTPVTVSGLDLHDGTILHEGTTDYMYGTEYGCGFTYGKTSPFCGFGVSEASSVSGPWSAPALLFSPSAVISANWTGDNGMTWSAMCGSGGAGCFNARMVLTPGGQYLLWFNAPGDKSRTPNHANPYWVMTCSGPAGPCGSPHKPSIYGCNTGGDFSIAVQGSTGYIVCSGASRIITIEQLAASDTDGINTWTGGISPGPAEGVGIYHSGTGADTYTAVYSDPNCGYCSGPPANLAAAPGATEVQAGYSTAPNLSGPWTAQGDLPGGFCTGQPRSAFSADGQTWEWVDEWTGAANETAAPVLLVPFAESPWSCAA